VSENNNNNKQNIDVHAYTHNRITLYYSETFQPTYSKLKKFSDVKEQASANGSGNKQKNTFADTTPATRNKFLNDS